MARSEDGDIWLHASPIEVGYLLEEWLWSRCLGAVLVSATLTALSSFSYFRHQVGLKEHDGTRYLRLRSPFDYHKAELYLPKMAHEPSAPAFTQELIDTLPRLLAGKEASLVLFSSYRQMNEVAVGLRAKGMSLLVQGKRPAAPCSSCTNRSATAARPASSLAPAASRKGWICPATTSPTW